MDGQIAESAAALARLSPPMPSSSSSTMAATATPFPVDSPIGPSSAFVGPVALSLASPSSMSSNSSFPPFLGPPADGHRDEVTAASFQLCSLYCVGLLALPPASRAPFFAPAVLQPLLSSALLSSPRLCVRQTCDASLIRFLAMAQSTAPDGLELAERLFCGLVDLVLDTPLTELQRRFRTQTESLFALLLRILSGCLASAGAMDFASPEPLQGRHPHLHSLSLCKRLFALLLRLQVEEETEGVADQTVIGLLSFTTALVRLHRRHDAEPSRRSGPVLDVQPGSVQQVNDRETALSHLTLSTGVLHFLYSHGLFDVLSVRTAEDLLHSASFPPLFRLAATRFACFELLLALSSTSPQCHLLLLYLTLRSHPPRPDLTQSGQFNYQPSLQKKPASIPYVGLHNLGATSASALTAQHSTAQHSTAHTALHASLTHFPPLLSLSSLVCAVARLAGSVYQHTLYSRGLFDRPSCCS